MPKKILAVDDDPLNQKLLSSLLTRADFEVYQAVNGKEAVDMAKEILPDLILMDIMMPVMDGFTACEYIRYDARTANIPIIILTALDTMDEKIRGFDAGANDYIPKPFKPLELLERINKLIK